MFEKVLVGYHGSERSEDALALARLLAGLGGGRVIAACVYWDVPLAPGIAKGGLDATPDDAQHVQESLGQRFGGEIQVSSVAEVSASRALHELAASEGADLIVVGSTSRGRAGQTLPGTTAEQLLHGASCAVAVAPVGYRDGVPGKLELIGAAYCAAPEALAALGTAHAIAERSNAKLAVIGVYDRRLTSASATANSVSGSSS